MTNEEKAIEIAKDNPSGLFYQAHYDAALKMSQWKEEQMIEKAVEWLEDNADSYIFINRDFNAAQLHITKIIEDFKQAMKGEQYDE